jgi:hypothetical protein
MVNLSPKKSAALFLAALAFTFVFNNVYAQAPAITYASPKIYIAGVTITPLGPTNAGEAFGIYAAATIFKNMNSPYSRVLDGSNNVYSTDNIDGDLYKFTPGGVSGTIYPSLNTSTGIANDAS